MENEVNEILEQGDVAPDYQEPVNELPYEEKPEEPQEEPKEEAKEEPKPEKKKLTFEERQAQIAKQIREKHEIQRQLDAEREQLRKEREELENLRKQYIPQEDLPPDPNKYQDDPARYVEDLTDWKANQKIKVKETKSKESQLAREEQERSQKLAKDWELKTQVKLQKDPSFSEREDLVVMVLQNNPNKAMYESIMESDLNVDLVDYLGANPEECLRIASLRGTRASVEIGKIEEKIQGRKSQPVTKAPAPINTVRSTGANGVRDITKIDDFAEYSRLMNKQLYG